MAKKMLSTKDLMKAFGVGHMTIYNWRNGTPTKDPLPHKKDDTGHVTFVESEVKAWAKKYALSFTPPTEPAPRGKPGPAKTPTVKAVKADKAATTKATPAPARKSVKAKFARAAKTVNKATKAAEAVAVA